MQYCERYCRLSVAMLEVRRCLVRGGESLELGEVDVAGFFLQVVVEFAAHHLSLATEVCPYIDTVEES